MTKPHAPCESKIVEIQYKYLTTDGKLKKEILSLFNLYNTIRILQFKQNLSSIIIFLYMFKYFKF